MASISPEHVCIFTTAHPTDDVRVYSRVATSLLDAGYRVTWVGPSLSYFTETRETDSRIDYRLFTQNSTRLRRLRASTRARRTARGVSGVTWWYSPDPDAAATAVRLARQQGGRVVFDIHEIFHGALLDRWFPIRPPRLIRQLVRRRIRKTCAKVDFVMGVSASVLRPYTSAGKPELVVRNCAPRWFAERARTVSEYRSVLRIMHGKVLPTNGAFMVVDALEELAPDVASRLTVCMSEGARGGRSAVIAEMRRRLSESWVRSSVELQPGVPHEVMPVVLQGCHVGMIAYGRDLGVDSLPNRLFEYMASGLAILAPEYAEEIAEIVVSEEIGILVDFEDAAAIASALQWLCDHPDEVKRMGERAQEAFLIKYNWTAEGARLIATMRERESA